MLVWLIAILLVLWVLGFITGAVGGAIHVLLLLAGLVFVAQWLQGRRNV